MKQNLYYLKFPHSLKIFLFNALLILLVTGTAFAQTNIKGKVTDGGTNEPLPGVKVLIKGTITAIATDVNGDYSISHQAAEDDLPSSVEDY